MSDLKIRQKKVEAMCLLGDTCYIIVPIDLWEDFPKAKEY